MPIPDEDSSKIPLEDLILEEAEAEMWLTLHEKGVPLCDFHTFL